MHKYFYNRNFINSIFLVFTILVFSNCYSQREVVLEDNQPIKIYKIEMLDNRTINFGNNKIGYALLSEAKIISKEKNGEEKVYQVSEVKKMYTEKFDYVKTFFTVAWGTAVLGVVLLVVLLSGGHGGLSGG